LLLAATASLLASCLRGDGARHSGAVTGVLEGRLVVGLDDDIDGITTVIVIPTTDAECNSGASLSSLDDAVGHSIEFTQNGTTWLRQIPLSLEVGTSLILGLLPTRRERRPVRYRSRPVADSRAAIERVARVRISAVPDQIQWRAQRIRREGNEVRSDHQADASTTVAIGPARA